MTRGRWTSGWVIAAGLAFGCGQGGGNAEAGETGDSTAGATTGTGSGTTTSSTTGSGSLTEGTGTVGQTEGQSPTTSAGTTADSATGTTTGPGTSGTTGTTTTTGEDTSTGGTTTGTTGAGLCDGFVEPGCINTGCPEGQKCTDGVDCVPSSCACDPQTGDIICTPDCGGGVCVGADDCVPIMCDLDCEFGFKTDEKGCEICECADGPPPACGCQSNADCVKTSPGCCSCNMGGKEVAIAAACIDMLEPCPLPPDQVVCPAVYLCTDAQAVCVNNQCALQ